MKNENDTNDFKYYVIFEYKGWYKFHDCNTKEQAVAYINSILQEFQQDEDIDINDDFTLILWKTNIFG